MRKSPPHPGGIAHHLLKSWMHPEQYGAVTISDGLDGTKASCWP